MNAPLSRYLTQFSAPPAMRSVEMPTVFAPRLSLTAEELDKRLEAAAAAVRSEAELRLKAEIETQRAEREAAVAQAVADARAEWIESQSDILIARIGEALVELHGSIADGLVRALRPLLSESLIERTTRELNKALAKLLADPDGPMLSVRGPSDLIAPLRRRFEDAAVEWVEADICEVTILADATRIDTCLGPALAELAQPGA